MNIWDYLELIIMFISAILIIPQIFLIKKQIKEGHEEHRRENTINMMYIWCNSLKKEASIAEEVARKLNDDQCGLLYQHQAFNVSDEIKNEICKFCPLPKSECSVCKIHTENRLEGKILNELRYHVICYLNMLETVMTSWHLGTVDRKTVENEFQFLVTPGKGMALSSFRHVAGGYPLIEEFIDTVKDRDSSPKTLL